MGNIKITFEQIPDGVEPEIVIRANQMDEDILQLIYSLRSIPRKLIGLADLKMYVIDPREVFYFESVDNKVFIYCHEKIFESKLKLYEIEKLYDNGDFFRSSKSTILNLTKIDSIKPVFYGRLEALLQNGEKMIISRQYVPVLKQRLGL